MNKFKLEFSHSYGGRSLVGLFENSAETIQELNEKNFTFFNMIKDFIHELNPNYKIYYFRHWINKENELVIDVGSHSEFFYVSKV